jgi:hypothetical protein
MPEFFARQICISYIKILGIHVPGGPEGMLLRESRTEAHGGLDADRRARRCDSAGNRGSTLPGFVARGRAARPLLCRHIEL